MEGRCVPATSRGARVAPAHRARSAARSIPVHRPRDERSYRAGPKARRSFASVRADPATQSLLLPLPFAALPPCAPVRRLPPSVVLRIPAMPEHPGPQRCRCARDAGPVRGLSPAHQRPGRCRPTHDRSERAAAATCRSACDQATAGRSTRNRPPVRRPQCAKFGGCPPARHRGTPPNHPGRVLDPQSPQPRCDHRPDRLTAAGAPRPLRASFAPESLVN